METQQIPRNAQMQVSQLGRNDSRIARKSGVQNVLRIARMRVFRTERIVLERKPSLERFWHSFAFFLYSPSVLLTSRCDIFFNLTGVLMSLFDEHDAGSICSGSQDDNQQDEQDKSKSSCTHTAAAISGAACASTNSITHVITTLSGTVIRHYPLTYGKYI
jgi:hypothetical protein